MKNLFQLFSGIKNPQQFLQSMMNNSQVMGNPMAKNAIDMMQNGDVKGVEQMARNLCKEKGVNPDEIMQQMKDKFGM
jgi:hypothetical protein|nr:MAG TPA: Peroxin 14 Translocation, PPI inhibition, Protein-Inhibitor [Caudoviricetes sp.]DAU98898.1 MAG TPA: Peroxin 14 Translocation, PPI inhibition, Protein-Inhibitor [Bacteriophage sp.]